MTDHKLDVGLGNKSQKLNFYKREEEYSSRKAAKGDPLNVLMFSTVNNTRKTGSSAIAALVDQL